MDAWCHTREDVRTFSLDAMRSAEPLADLARNIPDAKLDAAFTAGYGIFSGAHVQWVVLRFTPERARWVSREVWHPQQKGEFAEDGNYILQVPYSDDRELVMDILRHVPEVTVLQPAGLQVRIKDALEEGLKAMGAA
jgi:predicted DNA-binding transcriptional regulator YafY